MHRPVAFGPMRGTTGLREIEPRLRGAALFPLAAYLVHQLRYLLAAGGDAGHELGAQGHAYLSWLTLPITLLAAGGVGAFAAHLVAVRGADAVEQPARGRSGARPGSAPRGRSGRNHHVGSWLVLAGALLAVYAGQELLESALAGGHAAGLAGVVGGGGWLAVPAALAVGALLALLLRTAERVLRRSRGTTRRLIRAAVRVTAPLTVDLSPPAPLARRAAGRAPPPPLAPAH